jgi:hypothetical protein
VLHKSVLYQVNAEQHTVGRRSGADREESSMNRTFLMMVATISGLVMVVSLVLFPLIAWGKGDASGSARAIEAPIGGVLLLVTWLAAGFAGLSFLKKLHLIGLTDAQHRTVSFLGFKLSSFLLLALLIAGANHGSFSLGFWLAFIASIIGTFAVYLTFNAELAEKIATATKQAETPTSSGEDTP